MKTGTTTIGIVCKDGLVMAADRRATAGYMIVDKKAKKVIEITPRLAVTMAGTVSDAQLLIKLVKAELKLKSLRTGREPNVKESANMLAGLVFSNIRRFSSIPGITNFLMGGIDNEGCHMYNLYIDGSVNEVDDYVSSGSGSVMAYGVLETLYKPEVTMKEAITLSLKSLNAAMQRDIATGNGVDVITISKDGIKTVFEKEIDSGIKVQ